MKQLEAWCLTKCPVAPSSLSSSLLGGHEGVQMGWTIKLRSTQAEQLKCNAGRTTQGGEGFSLMEVKALLTLVYLY
jgi:hypothetical protein